MVAHACERRASISAGYEWSNDWFRPCTSSSCVTASTATGCSRSRPRTCSTSCSVSTIAGGGAASVGAGDDCGTGGRTHRRVLTAAADSFPVVGGGRTNASPVAEGEIGPDGVGGVVEPGSEVVGPEVIVSGGPDAVVQPTSSNSAAAAPTSG